MRAVPSSKQPCRVFVVLEIVHFMGKEAQQQGSGSIEHTACDVIAVKPQL